MLTEGFKLYLYAQTMKLCGILAEYWNYGILSDIW